MNLLEMQTRVIRILAIAQNSLWDAQNCLFSGRLSRNSMQSGFS
jgi:hypothetical protein